ncbi:MAG: RluA family pseudouridine synthase [Phycisphaerae bacterium]
MDAQDRIIPFTPGESIDITVGGDKNGERLDSYLCKRFGQLSRVKMQRVIRQQDIFVNGVKSKPSRKLHPSDVISLTLPAKEVLREPMELDIIYEDEFVIALNKPAGVIMHPARGNPAGTLLNGLRHYSGDSFTPDIVHRLDRDTTGLVIFSKSGEVNAFLSAQFEARNTVKTYKAIVRGEPADEGEINLPLGDHPDMNLQKQAVREDGRCARTSWRLEQRFGAFALLDVRIYTGRMHQIRVHLSHIGFPIVNDSLYGGEMAVSGGRCFLHSSSLQIELPNGKPLTLTAPLAADMADFLNANR